MTAGQKDEMLFNALLRTAIREAYENEINGLPDAEALKAYKPSEALDHRIYSQIKKSFRKIRTRKITRTFGKAVAVFCVLVTIASVALMSVEATRNAILNAIINWHDQYTEIHFGQSPVDNTIYQPTYLPEGFSEQSFKSTGNITTIIYENDAGIMIFFIQQQAKNATTMVDNEHTDFMEVQVADSTGYLFKARTAEDSSVLLWEKNGILYSLTSIIDYQELLRMGESLENY